MRSVTRDECRIIVIGDKMGYDSYLEVLRTVENLGQILCVLEYRRKLSPETGAQERTNIVHDFKTEIQRALGAVLPKGTQASDDVIYAFNECCAEFVNMVASEASELATGRIVSHTDVVEAMKKLGFDAYLEKAEGLAAEDAQRRGKRKLKAGPKLTPEEREAAAKRQRELLNASAESFYREQHS